MKYLSTKLCLVVGAMVLSLALPQVAWGETIFFDEVPTQPVHGLTVKGVTFDFRIGGVPSLDAIFNTLVGPGFTPFNSPPNLEGNGEGILTLDFAVPTSTLQFGAHVSVDFPVTPGLTVQLFDAFLIPIGGPIPLNMVPSPFFAGGMFDYRGTPARRAVIDKILGVRFSLDNLTFDAQAVPEPSTWVLLGIGTLSLAGYGRRRSKRAGAGAVKRVVPDRRGYRTA